MAAALTILDGGGSLSDTQAEREWHAAWATIAEGCDKALASLHPMHPRRAEMLALTRDAHVAVGHRSMPFLRGA